MPRPRLALLVLPLWFAVAACSPRAGDPARGASTAAIDVVEPSRRVTNLEEVEELSEAVANRLIDLGDRLRRRAFHDIAPFFAAAFSGDDLERLGAGVEEHLPLGVERSVVEPRSPPVVGPDRFIAGLRSWLAAYSAIEAVTAKLKAAEFAAGEPSGAGTVFLEVVGRGPDGGRLGHTMQSRVEFVERSGAWRLSAWHVTSFESMRRPQPLFVDVAPTSGVAWRGPRFGADGNDSFFWQGAAAYDVDADGRFDLFVPSAERNFLYRNAGDGTFEDVAGSAGVGSPSGGTSALFFDADGDGAVDLLVGHVGVELDGKTIGRSSVLYRNASAGGALRFEDVTETAGWSALHAAFGLAAADVENDGDLDVYVASYHAEGFVAPNSWYAASNGTPNALYLNLGGGTFADRARAAGVADPRWSYAAAFCDFDEDGDQDLYVANDYAENSLFRNRGDGTFEDVAAAYGVSDVGNGMGVTWGDHDADGDLDLYVANMSSTAGNRILRRLENAAEGTGDADALAPTLRKLAAGNSLFTWDGRTFEPAPSEVGGIAASWAWAAQFDDFDLDGDPDLLCVNGFISGPSMKDT